MLKYTKTHEWVRDNGDNTVTIGITDHAQEALGDIVFLEPPEVGRVLIAGEACAVVESVKAAADIYAPVAGEVIAVNTQLTEKPELLHTSPYKEGWIFHLAVQDINQLNNLLTESDYSQLIQIN